jgi:glyoxylase-like metal-dependent hydrolase (beta-lactamase superfamily II)
MPIRETVAFRGIEGARVGRFGLGINTTAIVYRIGPAVIDAGPPNQWPAVRRFLDRQPVGRLFLTHHHEDHAGNAACVARRYGLAPLAPEPSRARLAAGFATPIVQRIVWGRPRPVQTDPLPPIVELEDGTSLVAAPAPGHSDDMTCLLWPDRGVLFAADLYLSRRITHLRTDEDLGAMMRSLETVLGLDFDTVLCAHRGVVEDGPSALQAKLDWLGSLVEDVRGLCQQGVDEREVVRRLLGPEDGLSWVSRLDISKRNLVRQAAALASSGRLGAGRPR